MSQPGKPTPNNPDPTRRDFLRSAATAAGGAGLLLSSPALAQAVSAAPRELNVAVIGTGLQGRVLIDNCLKIAGIRFRALCDIWSYSQRYASRRLKKRGHQVNVYTDYREMLAREKQLDAVIVATPDWMHAEHTLACLTAGKHVYCEKEMSNDLAKARAMVAAARETGKLLQIGHQRRSNPRYLHAKTRVIDEAKLLGRITTASAQWNRAARPDFGWPKKDPMDAATLAKYGYASMHEFRNWRWFRKLGGGPLVDLGSHQIDVFSWFLGCNPTSVMASGGLDYYKGGQWKPRDWYDNVMAVYEYATPAGTVRAYYQVLTTTSARGYFETFMGDAGTMQISEDPGKIRVYAEGHINAPEAWKKWEDKGYVMRIKDDGRAAATKDPKDAIIEVYKSVPATAYLMPVEFTQSYHQPHLQNFFDAVRGKAKLNCPPELGYETAVIVLKANDAVAAARRLDFKTEDFKA